jgi:7-carboxy-7-deazaguanine synthase
MKSLPVLNKQPPEKQILINPDSLEFVGKPFATIQGEGPFAGTPATFIRLAGCNLCCQTCDTNYTKGRGFWGIDKIYHDLQAMKLKPGSLIVLTGGEPFRQPIGKFVNGLLDWGYVVQIETNGTLDPNNMNLAHPNLWIVCSPKTSQVSMILRPYVRCLKYIIEHGQVDPKDGLPTSVLGQKGIRPCRPWEMYQGEVMVQPMDERTGRNQSISENRNANKLHMKAAVESALKFGWRISLQIHKILGVA